MAFWNRRSVKGHTYLYVYTRKSGKQATVPRRHYKHLDGASDSQVEAWVEQWAAQNENARVTPDHILFSDDLLSRRLDEWRDYFTGHLGRDAATANKYHSLVRRYAIPYFLEKALKDPGQWPGVSIHLFDYLTKFGCSQVLIAEINNALRAFFKWLQEEGFVAWDGDLRLRNTRKVSKETPLEFALTPKDVLAFVKKEKSWEIRLLALAGYFLSLRPQETFALAPEDFAAGADIKDKECTKAMKSARLFAGLAVNIERQQAARGEAKAPKAHSAGWVSCFNKKAAALLAELVNDRPDGRMLGLDHRAIYRRWATATEKTKLATIDLKDLRRASIYWLGHNTKLEPIQLMKHARHKEFETTQLYLRRPKEAAPKVRTRLKIGA